MTLKKIISQVMGFQSIILRLQHLYMSLRTTPHLATNDTPDSNDRYTKSISDSKLWKNIMVIYLTFEELRLAALLDDFNPSPDSKFFV